MDGRDADALRGTFGIDLMIGDADVDNPTECPRCGYNAVLTFPAYMMSTVGVSALAPVKVCTCCYDATGDLDAATIDAEPCGWCQADDHRLCLVPACPCRLSDQAHATHPC